MRRLLLVLVMLGCGSEDDKACRSLADYACMRLYGCNEAPDYNACVANRWSVCEEWPAEKSAACEAAVHEQNCDALHAGTVPDACK